MVIERRNMKRQITRSCFEDALLEAPSSNIDKMIFRWDLQKKIFKRRIGVSNKSNFEVTEEEVEKVFNSLKLTPYYNTYLQNECVLIVILFILLAFIMVVPIILVFLRVLNLFWSIFVLIAAILIVIAFCIAKGLIDYR